MYDGNRFSKINISILKKHEKIKEKKIEIVLCLLRANKYK